MIIIIIIIIIILIIFIALNLIIIKKKEIDGCSYIKMNTTKQINIKSRTYYFYNDTINLENFDTKLSKIDKKSNKDINIYKCHKEKN